jgi:hypothetical protein
MFNGMKLAPDERSTLQNVQTLDQFLKLTKNLESQHLNKKDAQSRGSFQQNMASFKCFAEAYRDVFDALKVAPPFGAGYLAFGLFGAVVSVGDCASQHPDSVVCLVRLSSPVDV